MYVAGVQTAHTLILSRSISMIIYTIYKSVNRINGKVYIGFDSKWPKRKREHKSSSKKIKNKFYNAIRKYGWDSFTWEIIYQSKDGNHTLNVMENYFINEYDVFKNGYNSTLGGDGCLGMKGSMKGKHHTEETKKILSEKNLGSLNSYYGKNHTKEIREKIGLKLTGNKNCLGRILSEDTKTKISQKAKSRLKDPTKNPMFGKKHSAETIEKISNSKKGKIPWNKGLKLAV